MDLTNAPPTTLGKYHIRGTLGRGAMGTVFDGWDPVIGRRVAIKTVRLLDHSDPESQEGLERFKREAQAAGRLSHPNIVGVYDYGETDETAYIVMEFVEGQSLKQMLDARERFPVAETVRIMEQILAGLQFSHDSGVIHRDIKPGNVMLAKGGRVKLADFGIARIESSVMTQDGTMLGTPAYMSPEQLMALAVDARTDLYSAGVVLYQLLTGERPFEGGLTAIIHKALNTTPPRPSEIAVTAPPAFDAVVSRAMARRPADRYPDADAFALALRQALHAPAPPAASPAVMAMGDDDATVVARPRPPPATPMPAPMPAAAPVHTAPLVPQPPAGGGPNMAVIGGVVAVVLLGIGGGAWFALRPSTPPPPQILTAFQSVEPPSRASASAAASAAAPAAKPVVTASPPAAPAVEKPPEVPAASLQVTATPVPAEQQAAQSPAKPVETPAAPQPSSKPAENAPPTTSLAAPSEVPAQIAKTPEPITLPVAQPLVAQPPIAQPPIAQPPLAEPPVMQPPVVKAPVIQPPVIQPTVAPPAIVPMTPPAPTELAGIVPPNPASIREALANLSLTAACAIPRIAIADDGGVSVTGIVGTGEPAAALHEAAERAVGNGQLSWLMRPVDGPYCGAFNLVRPLAQPSSPAFGLTLKDDVTRLKDREAIRPILRLPDFPAHLQVDYLSHDGSVTHLFPATGARTKPIAANATLPLGDPKQGVGAVGPPYGTDVIIAIASSVPLFPQGRPADAETAETYLPVLRAAIDAARRGNAKLTGRALVLETVAR